jgi:EAL domain-containing protein (putative c-di-GMP-specific phosphodiesterase class I)/GGDEF domain-containing protein
MHVKELISNIADEFYELITKSQYFASFFLGKDLDKIKPRLRQFLVDQLTSQDQEKQYKQAYSIGVMHASQGVPLNNVFNFIDFFQSKIYKYCDENRDRCSVINLSNLDNMKNWFAKGYLHKTIEDTDMMSIPLFSVLSTTRVATSIISWMLDLNKMILNEGVFEGKHHHNNSCDLMNYLNKPFFNMIFESEDNFMDFNRMHVELHNTANSLLYFMDEKSYAQAYFVYNDFVEQCKSFLNFYFERVVLFEQNNRNYFYKFIKKKVEYGRQVTVFTFNIRNMQMINKIWGLEVGDHIVNQIERLIDKQHGMNSENSVYIKTKNAEFIIVMINHPISKALEDFNNMNAIIERFLLKQEDYISDVRISSAFIPFGDQSFHHIEHLKQIVHQAVSLSKNNDNKPLICNFNIISQLNKNVLYDEKIRHFIKKSFDSNNFRPFYHTIVDSRTGELSHVEALARVCDKDSCISAGSFIDYLVKTGRVVELDKVMLTKILDDFPKMQHKVSKIFINISPRSLRASGYVQALKEFIVKADAIGLEHVFEITEQSLFDNLELVRSIHKSYGSVFAIDDFGSGYSNFSIVSDLGQEGLIEYLKIDGSLIKDIHENIYKENIVAGIIRIATSLNMKTVAEFVSDEAVAAKVKKLKATYMQGFHFSIPEPIENLI